MLQVSGNVKKVVPPIIDAMVSQARELRQKGVEIIDLGQGVSNLHLPQELVAEAISSATETSTSISAYSGDRGLEELRREIAKKLKEFNNIEVDPDKELLVTAGSNQGFMEALVAILDPGDEVILPAPFYFNQEMAVRLVGAVPVEAPMREDRNGYHLDPDEIAKNLSPRTKAVVLVSPNNPTGAVYSEEDIRKVAAIALEKSIYVLSDEAYETYVFGRNRHFSIGSIPEMKDRVITFGSFSKSYAMAGMRVGYLAADKPLVDELLKVHDTMIICAPVISQAFAISVMRAPLEFHKGFTAELERRADYLRAAIDRMPGLEWREPMGGLFAFVKYNSRRPSFEFASEILREARVVLIPGSGFGRYGE
ncbi:MAG: pyridoxal phosphate-dependent aminotransferase, partial [Candidatus Brocadiales bacterium]